LKVLTEEFGPYPYDEFAIAEVPNDKAEQAGFAGASMGGFMLADTADLDEPFNLAYYAHEIGHQWWGNLVTQTGPRGASVLNEGLAQFGSLLAVETLEGEAKAEQYRRDGYPGYNPQQCGVGYLMLSESGLDHRLLDLPRSLVSHTLADSKGFLVLDALSRAVGRDKFRNALRAITSDFAFRSITWEDFIGAVQRASGQDLGWFWDQWFDRTGAPDWQLAWKQDAAGLHVSITQPQPYYRANLELEVKGVNYEAASRQIHFEGGKTEFTWPVPFRVASVELDPHFLVLHWLAGLRAKAQARGPSLRASYVREDGKLDEAETILRDALAHLPQPDPFGAQFLDEYEMARVMMKKKAWQDAQAHFDAALAAPSRDPEVLPWLFYHYAEVAQALHDDAKLRWAVESAVSADAALPASSGAAGMAHALLRPKE
jgi:tetratricopeptide (TPR) repeat protein